MKRLFPTALALVSLALASGALRLDAPVLAEEEAVQVAGLMSQRELTREGDFGAEMPFPGSLGAVRVVLEVDLARVKGAGERRIVDVLRDESKVTRFVDDKGTDLAAGFDGFGGPYEMMPSVSEDMLRVAVTVGTQTAPAAGASRVELDGSVALFCASKRDRADSKEAALEKGTKLEVGPFSFEVSGVGEPDWGDAAWAITLRTKTDPARVTAWWIVDEDGKAVELDQAMSGSMGSVFDRTLNAPREFERGSLRIEYWADGETLEVPYAVRAGVGL